MINFSQEFDLKVCFLVWGFFPRSSIEKKMFELRGRICWLKSIGKKFLRFFAIFLLRINLKSWKKNIGQLISVFCLCFNEILKGIFVSLLNDDDSWCDDSLYKYQTSLQKKITIDIILGEYLSGSFNIDSLISRCSGSKTPKHKIELAKTYHYNDGSGSGGRISWDRNSTFSGDQQIGHEVEIPNNDSFSWSALFSWDWNCLIVQKKALLGNFDLMIDLLVTSMIMRSKFKKHF